MISTGQTPELERDLIEQISKERLWEYVSTIAKDQRMSGSPEEREAIRYIAETLRSWDVAVEEYEHDGYVSEPRHAELQVRSPEILSINCITHSFAASGDLSGEVAYVGNGDAEDYVSEDVRDRIVLLDGFASPGRMMTAQEHGASAAIFTSHGHLYQRILTPVWGTPTPDTADLIPTIPAATILHEDVVHLRSLLERGSVIVALTTEVWTGWAKLPIIVGTIDGAEDPDHFAMLAGHIDSWFYGAVDNGGANATTLEVMRIMAANRGRLRRGFRVVFWSGHSHGRYAGSTWYADTFWEELYDRCVAYLNVDSTGAVEATLYEEILAMAETSDLAKAVIADVTGQNAEVNRVGRAGDQSFWGIGIPSIFMSLSRVPSDRAPELSKAMGALLGRKKSGQAWFWHTEHDTLDKIDLDVLATDTKVYLATALRVINSDVLPFNYSATADEIVRALERYQQSGNRAVDLTYLIDRAGKLRDNLDRLNAKIAAGVSGEHVAELNDGLIALGRSLVPINYSSSGQFDHDLAVPSFSVPALREIDQLARLDPHSDQYRFHRTKLVRRRNRIAFALRRANSLVEKMLDRFEETEGE